MIVFIDENMPKMLAHGFNILQAPENIRQNLKDPIIVKSIIEEFGAGALDEDWIPKVGNIGACVITQDSNINRIRHQRELCEKHKLGMFYFKPPSKNGFTYWQMIEKMTKHWPEIVKVASKKKRPFSYKITSKSTRLEEMK